METLIEYDKKYTVKAKNYGTRGWEFYYSTDFLVVMLLISVYADINYSVLEVNKYARN